nr:PREDICTED: protein D1-like [Bemisia tabaci]XP_018913688.1 PREDICTED: protein D1-like [Bemisia tabaci]
MLSCCSLKLSIIIQTCFLCAIDGKSTSSQPLKITTSQPPQKLQSTEQIKGGAGINGVTPTPPLWTFGTLWELLGGNGTTWVDLPTPSTTTAQPTTPKDIELILRNAKVIPDVLNKRPPHEIQVSFYNMPWNLGRIFDKTDVREAPHYLWWISEADTYYTLLLISPDFPGEHDHCLAQYQHWVVVNIPGLWVEGGETLASYVGLEPYGIGKHRLVLLLFKQPSREKIGFSDELIYTRKDVFNRGNFSALRFATKYDLGDPIAVNFCVLDMDILPEPFY